MWRFAIAALALCIFSTSIRAEEDPLAWFPLKVGTRWTYEHEWKSGNRKRPAVNRWTSEETIKKWVNVPEGLVVLRETKVLTGAANQVNSSYLTARSNEPYMLHGACVYVIGDGWDSQNQKLRSEYREHLSQGNVPADLCFPLQLGRKWGNNEVPWRVERPRASLASFLPAQYTAAIHIFSEHLGRRRLERCLVSKRRWRRGRALPPQRHL